MKTVSVREARRHLRRLVEAATRVEAFIIARAGFPLVKFSAVSGLVAGARAPRIGFLEGEAVIPRDFDELHAEDIRALFEGPGGGGPAGR